MPGLGQIGLVHSGGFGAWLIRTVTGSSINHTVTYIGNDEVISCEPSGVTILPIDRFPNVAWSHFPLELQQVAAVINFSRAQLGKPYDRLMFVWCGVARLLRVEHTPRWVLRRLASYKAWICSQLCDDGLQAAGIDLFPDKPEGAVVPGDFEPIWREQGWPVNVKDRA